MSIPDGMVTGAWPARIFLDVSKGDVIEVTRYGHEPFLMRVTAVSEAGMGAVTIHTEPLDEEP